MNNRDIIYGRKVKLLRDMGLTIQHIANTIGIGKKTVEYILKPEYWEREKIRLRLREHKPARKLYNSTGHRKQANIIRSITYNGLTRGKGRKDGKTEYYLGCTIDFAIAHIENQFLPGMTWDNHGLWHIDHIKPCVEFDLEHSEEDRLACAHYTNLKPLWAEDNLSKGSKWQEPDDHLSENCAGDFLLSIDKE